MEDMILDEPLYDYENMTRGTKYSTAWRIKQKITANEKLEEKDLDFMLTYPNCFKKLKFVKRS